ncbi:MAG: single-stranded DNA-binding protein [Syntrophorhabdaceae bacterium]|nr:single-stranded DNA-binding protein [Syntrophorhabdaceae bacterium]
MVSFNRVIIAGNLTRDPETRFIPSGTAVTEFSVAVNSRYKSKSSNEFKEEVSYFDIVVFGKMGENCAEYLSKGRAVLVEGRLRQRRWEQDGVKRSKIEILADNVQFLRSGSGSGPAQEGGFSSPSSQESPDDDIPF